jgi:4-hydroxyphenylpyruvate dioxygenase
MKLQAAQAPAFDFQSFHHVEFCCGDAITTTNAFKNSLGMETIAKSDLSTGNTEQTSIVLQSGGVKFVLSAASNQPSTRVPKNQKPFPNYSQQRASRFFKKHGLAACAVALAVSNVPACFAYMIAGGGVSVLKPTTVRDTDSSRGSCMMAEVSLYGDVVIRLVDARNFMGTFLPNYQDVVAPGTKLGKYGIDRIDHVVGNVQSLQKTLDYIKNMTVSHLVRNQLRIHAHKPSGR